MRTDDAVQRRDTVLLADDNNDLRWLTRIFLERAGLTVLETADGNHAAFLAEKNAGQIDLLIADVRMPGMDGRELARYFRSLNPNAAVLLVSGLPPEYEDHAFLAKPFSMKQLVGAVQDLLGFVVLA